WSRTVATRGEWQRLLRLCRRTVVEVDRNRTFSASRSRRSRTLFCRQIPCLTWYTPLRGSLCLLVPESGRDGCFSRSHVRRAPRRERRMHRPWRRRLDLSWFFNSHLRTRCRGHELSMSFRFVLRSSSWGG
ncbi:unnamed protein product, partial [Scytosiphon promiscuus]